MSLRIPILSLALLLALASGCRGQHTVRQRLDQYAAPVEARLKPAFEAAGVTYPPTNLVLVAFKEERQLLLYASGANGRLRLIKTYPILAASGRMGPKLREGDRQVPEGFYRIESLNPDSRFHLSLRINYPNAFDREQAQWEGRTDLGGDIMIHGNRVSIGCLAMGDPASEELFVAAALAGLPRIRVLLCPCDLRRKNPAPPEDAPRWTAPLYHNLRQALTGIGDG